MDRRDFVRVSALAGVALGGKPLFGETLAGEATPKVLKRRFDVAPFELEETTIGDLQAAMARSCTWIVSWSSIERARRCAT